MVRTRQEQSYLLGLPPLLPHPLLFLLAVFAMMFVGIFSLSSVSAAPASPVSSYEISYNLPDADSGLVSVSLVLSFVSRPNEYRIYVPLDASDLVEAQGISFTSVDLSNQKVLIFNLKNSSAQGLRVQYLTGALTEPGIFIASNLVPDLRSYTAAVTLAPGAVLETPVGDPKPSVFPVPSRVESDGQRLTIRWDALASTEPILIKFKGETAILQNPLVLGAAFIVLVLVLGYLLFSLLKKRSVSKQPDSDESIASQESDFYSEKPSPSEAPELSLYEEEQKIIAALQTAPQGELWQRELARRVNLGAVKLTRRLRGLEQRGMIEKVPYGNTNKIRIKKST